MEAVLAATEKFNFFIQRHLLDKRVDLGLDCVRRCRVMISGPRLFVDWRGFGRASNDGGTSQYKPR
jgi:hypothetical protein